MHTPRKVLLSGLAGVLVAAVSNVALAGDPRGAIEETLARFTAAFNSGDAAGVGALYSEDAVILPPGGESVSGREAITAFWQGAIEGGLTDLELQIVELEAQDGRAFEVGKLRLMAPGEGGEMQPVLGKYIVVWKQDGEGNWRLHRDIWNTSPAAE